MALKGRHLKVGADIWVPWVDLRRGADGRLSPSGVAAEFFDIIANKLNFTYTLTMPADREWGRGMPNGSFTGMVGMCQRREIDMALGPFAVTYERSKVLDFSLPLFIDRYAIFLPRPRARMEGDLSGITRPFAWQVWVAIIVSAFFWLATGLIMSYVSHRGMTEGNGSGVKNVVKTTGKSSWRLIVSTTMQTKTSWRVFLAAWILSDMILKMAYSGVLTSLLAVPKVNIPVNSLQDLVNYGKIPWGIEQGTALHQLFSEAKSGLYKKITDGGILVTNAYDARIRVKKEELAVICDILSMKKVMSDDFSETGQCNYYISEEFIKSASISFAFPKGSDLVRHFDQWMGPLQESGLISRKVLELTRNATACLVKPGKEGDNVPLVLSLMDLAGTFGVFAGGLLAGIITFALEMLVKCSKFGQKKMP